uniref:Sulfur globule protein CV1 domain protein n=1 Tax=Strongyloides venezuelensis TaxID=75913 RepID=A0A0K0FC80_STRVS
MKILSIFLFIFLLSFGILTQGRLGWRGRMWRRRAHMMGWPGPYRWGYGRPYGWGYGRPFGWGYGRPWGYGGFGYPGFFG